MNKNEIVKTTYPNVPAELNDPELLRLADTIWNVKQLQRQMGSGLFLRIALSKDKKGVLQLAYEGIKESDIQKPEDAVRNSYLVEFLGLPSKKRIREKDLQKLLCEHMKIFLLELGRGFMFRYSVWTL